ncbi:winged helix-turn-helix transcriptional regulator [Alcaligenaceae bacterium]|nr:winged helix-turn-helix transcriptional regulator [Alcaligenaceae bacterium]
MSKVSLNTFLSYRINQVSESVVKIGSQVYEREVHLTLRELRVLRTVRSTPGIAHSDVVDRVFYEKSLVSRLVTGLVNKSYLKRAIDPLDARRISLTLTKKGETILAKADRLGLDMNKAWLSNLTEEERANLDTYLETLAAGLHDLAVQFDVNLK